MALYFAVILDTILRNYPHLITVIYVVLTVVVAVVVERLTTRYLRGFSRRRELPPDVENGLVLTFRLLILLGAVIAIFRVGGIPTELLVAYSALGGAAVIQYSSPLPHEKENLHKNLFSLYLTS